jgi:hypothetical protein
MNRTEFLNGLRELRAELGDIFEVSKKGLIRSLPSSDINYCCPISGLARFNKYQVVGGGYINDAKDFLEIDDGLTGNILEAADKPIKELEYFCQFDLVALRREILESLGLEENG